MYISSEKIHYYAKNKPYMVGLHKLLPIPQCLGRWTDEQKAILSNVKKIEEELKDCDITISDKEYIHIVKEMLKQANIKHGITYQLFDGEKKKDKNGYTHSYNSYRYVLNIIDENSDIVDQKKIFTVVRIDEPTPYLSGSVSNFKLIDLLKNEDLQNTIKEYPEVATLLSKHIEDRQTKKEI